MRFPDSAAKVSALCLAVANGLEKAAGDFPNPPVPPANLLAAREAFHNLEHRVVNAEAELAMLYTAKREAREKMETLIKQDLRYAEVEAGDELHKLTGLGWGGRREKRRLEPPGEVRDIEVGRQGETTVELRWKAPVDGGKVTYYEIQRRDGTGGGWSIAYVAPKCAAMLEKQPRGIQMEYRILASNRAGQGGPSAVVGVVL